MITIPIVLAVVMYLILPACGWMLCAFFTGGSQQDEYTRGYIDGRKNAANMAGSTPAKD